MEYWRFVEGFKSRYGRYRVSNMGRVKNGLGNELKPHKHKKGYVMMSMTQDGKEKRKQLHRIVAMAWIPNPDNLPQVNHKDGNKKNNMVSNLEWCTNLQNTKHAIANGLFYFTPRGGKCPSSHLTDKQAADIKKMIGYELSLKEISKIYGVSLHVIKDISRGRTYLDS